MPVRAFLTQDQGTASMLAQALEQSPSSIIITDISGDIVYVNPRFTDLTEYQAGEVIGRNPRLLQSGMTQPEVYDDLWRALSQGQEWRGLLYNKKKSGEHFWVDASYSAIKDSTGTVSHYIAYQRDISTYKHNEDMLHKLSLAVQQSANTIMITDLDGNIEYVNPKFLELTGYSPEEVIGRNPRLLKSDLTPPEVYEDMWMTIASGREWWGELCNRRKGGELFWEYGSITPVKDSVGHITHYLAVKEDITARKLAEETLQHYAQELEERNEELDAYAHTIAHDLKNPLNVILNYLDLCAEHIGTAETPARIPVYIDRSRDMVFKMTEMIDQLLFFSSLRDAHTVFAEVDMAQVIETTLKRFGRQFEERQIVVQVEPEIPFALGQPLWLEEVFANLISNAIKYMGSQSTDRRITLRGYRLGAVLRYEVQDTGLGIDPADQQRLFEMLTRFHAGVESGFGIGLSIVRRIVTKLNGQVGVESAPGQGSTFWFDLPSS